MINIDDIVNACVADPAASKALAERLRKTLRPWEPTPGVLFAVADTQQYCRINLLGEIVARGHKSYRDMRRGDESLVEQGFTLLDDEDKG